MKKPTFTLTNAFSVDIDFQLEPEAEIYKLRKGKSVEIEITPSSEVSVDLQINELNESPGFYLSIWHDQGEYKVLSEDY